jgi:hypothetical protein
MERRKKTPKPQKAGASMRRASTEEVRPIRLVPRYAFIPFAPFAPQRGDGSSSL